MAKGQKRSSREIRKPKQTKAPPPADSSFASQIRAVAKDNAPRGKGRG